MKIMKKPAMKIMAMKAQVAALTMNLTKAQAAASAVRAMKSMKTHGKAAKMAASNGATTMKRMKSQTAASSAERMTKAAQRKGEVATRTSVISVDGYQIWFVDSCAQIRPMRWADMDDDEDC